MSGLGTATHWPCGCWEASGIHYVPLQSIGACTNCCAAHNQQCCLQCSALRTLVLSTVLHKGSSVAMTQAIFRQIGDKRA